MSEAIQLNLLSLLSNEKGGLYGTLPWNTRDVHMHGISFYASINI